MQLKRICQQAMKLGFTHLLCANGKQIPLSEVESKTVGWRFNGAKSVDPELLKYSRNWELLGIYKLRKN